MNRVVVTGLGVVSPVGNGCDAFWDNLTTGHSGIGGITLFDVSSLPVRIGGEVKELDADELTRCFPDAAGQRDRKIWLGLAAAQQAFSDAGLGDGDLSEASLHVGMSLEAFCLDDLIPLAQGLGREATLSRMADDRGNGRLIQSPLERLGQLIGDRYEIQGGRWTNCSACAAGGQVIGEAFHSLREGGREIAMVGAADSMLNPLGLGGFSLLRILSAENETPQRACRPFDASREGTVLGEGAAFLVIETLEHAKARGARIYAEMLGYGSSMDAFRVSDPEPNGRGAVLSMTWAIQDAKMGPGDIDCVNAHGTGTPKNDIVETSAIKEVLGPRARQVPVHAVKSMTGHLIAASGAVEAVAAVLTLSNGMVPPTINLKVPDPECDLDYVPEGARQFEGRTVLSNSFGFGGQNATLVLGKWQE